MRVEQGLGPSEDGDVRVDNDAKIVNNGTGGAIQVHDGLSMLQQQSQISMIRWERFLPRRSLKVLLVENDDSTRHVVTALLRNCSYEVTTAANGLQAWKILQDMSNHIDLVLTEVVMPILSGIGLLSKIMIHKTLKNIPVIMMSSNDSMGLVFKCLSRGAVDFLVKPIRKNELKNLWQHVWRRCHSSSGSGSGSESGTQARRSTQSRSGEESGNNSDSSNELDDNGSNGPSIRDGSDNGSGTQSSWTKKAAEFESHRQLSPTYQLADAPDSTCAQVIHTKPETSGDRWLHVVENVECEDKNEQIDDTSLGKDPEFGVSGNPDVQCDCQNQNLQSDLASKKQNKLPDIASKPLENGQLENKSDNMIARVRDQGTESCNRNGCYINQHAKSKKVDASDVLDIQDSGDSPSLELSLNRLRGLGDGGNASGEERNVLRHSDLSAFSKYNTASSANQGPTGNVGSCSPVDNSSVAMKTETAHNIPFYLRGTFLNQQSNGSSYNDIASTAKNVIPKPEAVNEKSESSSAFKSFHSSAFQPVQNGRICSPKQMIAAKTEEGALNSVQAQFEVSHQPVQVLHHHHHHHRHHHYHHHVHNRQQHHSQPEHDDVSLKNLADASPQCGSSNMVGGPTEGTAGNYSMNGSGSGSNHGSNGQNGYGSGSNHGSNGQNGYGSGSNHGSNGQNGGSTGLNTGMTNVESDNQAAVNGGPGGIAAKFTGNAVDEDRVAQREAALSKFRQKRKERCFEKRVRYQSRKRLAEQRPRVKGQFVRQTLSDNKAGNDVASTDLTSEDNSCDSLR